ncbi:hypothetical protein RFM41_15925 [Mesorhizobium sp. VK25A]|uniref:Uncharacterized protein n=1 Tax=Mesorhizobium vachelliae TaxID=3072309 RepID=A0ABU5A438_9HYPH|nr:MULTISPECIES: hypothetical protein [unclassified Mesorhizobium]MDX8532459.1 hypothetical protein [Mesorhizobium sp. VK25D]MDX8545237.1 hypothetical protein [Mesorhizobium sp. VK25A]
MNDGKQASCDYHIISGGAREARGRKLQPLEVTNTSTFSRGDQERRSRLEKMVRLKQLRSGAWLALDLDAEFHDVIDCGSLFETTKGTGADQV